jgi:HK97 family phage major capsid protein
MAMTINELITRRAKAWEAAKAFLDSHRGESGILSAEDSETYDRMEKDIMDLSKEIERLNRQAQIEKQLSQPLSAPLTGRPESKATEEPKRGRASSQYATDMLTAMRSNFRQVTDVLQEGADTDGGYLVPAEWDERLIQTLNEENVLRSLGTTIKTSGQHKINLSATKPAAAWIEEGGKLQFADMTFGQKVLDAHKLSVAVKVTEELLADNAFDLANYITTQFGVAIANAEEDAFLNGDGQGKPTGIFDATNGGTKALELADTKISTDDVLTLIYSLKRPYRKKASFIMNDVVLSTIRKLKDNNGAYLWQPSYQAGEPDRLCGYEVHPSAYAPVLATGSPVMAFGDYSYYNIGDRGTRTMQELRELYAENGLIGYVCKERVDGLLVLPEAVQIMTVKAGA